MSNYFDNKDLFLEPKVSQYGSHMVMTNVYKSSKTKYINIDTRFRDEYNYTETVNYNITLPERINDVKKLRVKSVELPITFYNISSTLGNNYFKLTQVDSQKSAVITLDDGQYDTAGIVSEINSKISLLDGSLNYLRFQISENRSSFYREKLNTYDSDLQIDFAVDKYGSFDKYNVKTKLGWILGYRNITYTIYNNYGVAPVEYVYSIGECFVDLTGCRYLYLAIDEFSKSNPNSFITPLPTSFINKTIIARITMDKAVHGFGSVLPADIINGLLISDERTYTGKIDIHKLNIQLLSEYGLPISINGMDFSFCLEIEHE